MKKIIASLAMIALVGTLVVGATMAIFSDTETSYDNTFIAGTLDLKVDGEDNPGIMHINLSDMAPCDGVGATEHCTIKYQWTLSNSGSIAGQPWIEIVNLVDYENGRNDPERDVDGTGGNPGAGSGELSQYLMMQINAAGSGGFEYPHGGCIWGGRLCTLAHWAGYGPVGQDKWQVIEPGSITDPMVLEFQLPCDVDNIVQSDSVEFDIVFHLDQVTP